MNKLYNLIEIRKEHNYTQRMIAKYLSISLTKYNNIENGKIYISPDDLYKLSYLFNVRGEYLTGVYRKILYLTKNDIIKLQIYFKKIRFIPNLKPNINIINLKKI